LIAFQTSDARRGSVIGLVSHPSFRLLGPFRAARLRLRRDLGGARPYPVGEALVPGDTRAHERNQHRNRQRRVGHHAQARVIHALVVERPTRKLQVAEADLDPLGAFGNHRR
jgi:hypothetical protein